jgi:Ca2+-binding EF-hand superfamily protein
MRIRFLKYAALALGTAGLLGGAACADDQPRPIPGPIQSVQDLQDTAKLLFKLADTNNDGLISQKEAVDAGNLLVGGFFFRADANGDGVLTPEEGRAARDSLYQQSPLLRWVLERAKSQKQAQATKTAAINEPKQAPGEVAQNLAANPARAITEILDTNHDGKLSASELRQDVQTGVQALFLAGDRNQDGQLSPAELNQVVADATKAAIQATFQAADTDHNGMLSIAEFDTALTEPAHAVFRILDANADNQLTLEELDRAQRIIADQIQRLRVNEPSNSLSHQSQASSNSSTAAPAPGVIPGTVPVTTRRP